MNKLVKFNVESVGCDGCVVKTFEDSCRDFQLDFKRVMRLIENTQDYL